MSLCWIYKKLIAHFAAEGKPMPGWINTHLQACNPCKEHFQAGTRLTKQLIAQAECQRIAPSPFLHARILSSLRASNRRHEAVGRAQFPAWSGAVAAALLAIAAVVFVLNQQHFHIFTNPQDLTPENTQNVINALMHDIDTYKNSSLVAWSSALEQPLQNEIQSAVGDARIALQFLASDFLPTASVVPPDNGRIN